MNKGEPVLSEHVDPHSQQSVTLFIFYDEQLETFVHFFKLPLRSKAACFGFRWSPDSEDQSVLHCFHAWDLVLPVTIADVALHTIPLGVVEVTCALIIVGFLELKAWFRHP